MERFEIQHEMEDEPTYVCDTATDPDEEKFEVVEFAPTIPAELRLFLAKLVKAVLKADAKGDAGNPWQPVLNCAVETIGVRPIADCMADACRALAQAKQTSVDGISPCDLFTTAKYLENLSL